MDATERQRRVVEVIRELCAEARAANGASAGASNADSNGAAPQGAEAADPRAAAAIEARKSEEDRAKQAATIAAQYAYALYRDVQVTTGKPVVSAEMESRAGVPSDPDYFDSVEAIEEFIKCLDSRNATTPEPA